MSGVTPYDHGTYLVESRTRDGIEHLADLTNMTCSCEAALDFAATSPQFPCYHIERAIMHRAKVTPVTSFTGSILALSLLPK